MRISRRWWWMFFWCSWWSPAVFAQLNPNSGNIDFPGNVAETAQGDYDVLPDTSKIFYFFADNPGEEFSFADSLLGNYFQQYDPIRRLPFDYVNLGNLGSAARPIVYEPRYRMGFDLGLHQFDLYQTRAEELPFYRIERTYTNLGYFQRSEQADSYLTAQFSRNFSDGLNFAIDYKRISQLGRSNQFLNQNTRNTAFATGLWYHSPGGRYDGFFSMAFNTIEQEDNGGILQEPSSTGGFSTPSAADVFLEEAQTRYNSRHFSYTQYLTFGPKEVEEEQEERVGPPPYQLRPAQILSDTLRRVDSLNLAPLRDSVPPAPADTLAKRGNQRRFTIAHQIQYLSGAYKFFDEAVDTEGAAAYYGDFLTDPRGLRFYVRQSQVENTFRLRTFRPGKNAGNKGKRQRDLLELGLMHRFVRLDFEAADSSINNLFLLGRLHFQPGERLRIRTYGHFGLLDHAGDYRLFGELFLQLGGIGQLTVTGNNQLYEPNLMQNRLFVSQRPVWSTNFGKTLETNLSATYSLPQFAFEISGRYHLLNNYIYYDSLAMPVQTGVPISILQLLVRKDFRVGRFHLDNTVALQRSSEDFIRVPEVWSKHSLYYEGRWFRRVMLLRLGFDARLATTYKGYYYFPLTGQFTLQEERDVPFYPSVDAFISVQITRFRAFFKMENLSSMVFTDRLYYLDAFYPFQTGSGFRFGARWRFVD